MLVLRLWLAQEFFTAGLGKLSNGWVAPDWFTNLNFPILLNILPFNVNWILVSFTEIICSIMLLIGFFGRVASLLLIFISLVAIYTSGFNLGLAGWNKIDQIGEGSGFKILLMIIIMLLLIAVIGVGSWSVDYLLHTNKMNL